jgi:hypothetical protein
MPPASLLRGETRIFAEDDELVCRIQMSQDGFRINALAAQHPLLPSELGQAPWHDGNPHSPQ